GFRGPRESGKVTPDTLFRGTSAGGRRGPFLSQFLVRDVPLSPIRVPQKIRTAIPQRDYMTGPEEWLAMQNGQLAGINTFVDGPRYIRNGRDLGEYVHRDFSYQACLCACMILLKMSAPLDGGIPYQYSITQGGFVTFGPSDIFHLVATVANGVLKAAWFQKWIVHRRARPEELGGRLHYHLAGKREVPLHADILQAEAVRRTKDRTGTWFLPQAYPEGSPSHPSYPAGHAVIAGACSTVLKACFAETWVLPGNVQATPDGLSVEPYKGAELTVGGELDKLAENIAIGRNFAGIHWRSDGIEGIKLGEAYAIAYIREMKLTSSEFFHGFSLTRFDGTRITV
ncbi:MAG: vanadium-dependent haloperoxidase, partial [Thermoanaerobaculia bacterium]